ncbi:MAG TPA: dihydropteroate synthase [Chthoniobacterales bacterium]|nr:dihydropteroate synthase [Chthoniobacterales bacterium]
MGERLWKIGNRTLDLSQRGLIMGILNVTPDSFSDGGEFLSVERAVEHGVEMATAGADIVDIGGESTRPRAEPVSLEEELGRVMPVIEKLRAKTEVTLSIDTSKAEVAKAAIKAGATIVNDVTGGRADRDMLPVVAEHRAGLIVMHMQGTPQTMQIDPRYDNVVSEVADFFRQQYTCAIECGVDPMAIAFDPGIGFGKTLTHNLALLGKFEQLRVYDRPLVVGVSRKSFLTKVTGSSEMPAKVAATAALTALLWDRGAQIFRVHDVAENVAALRAAEALSTTG